MQQRKILIQWKLLTLSPQGNGPKTGKTLSRESDSEFEPEVMSSDDEETIALEETLDTADASQRLSKENDEVEALKRESEIPLEDLLDELPQEYLDSIGKSETDVGADKVSFKLIVFPFFQLYFY